MQFNAACCASAKGAGSPSHTQQHSFKGLLLALPGLASLLTKHTVNDTLSVQHAVDQLKELLEECSPFQHRIPYSISFKAVQQQLEGVTDATQLSEVVLSIEAAVSHLGSGPRGMYCGSLIGSLQDCPCAVGCKSGCLVVLPYALAFGHGF